MFQSPIHRVSNLEVAQPASFQVGPKSRVSIPYSSGLKFRDRPVRISQGWTRARFQSPIHRVSNLELGRMDSTRQGRVGFNPLFIGSQI